MSGNSGGLHRDMQLLNIISVVLDMLSCRLFTYAHCATWLSSAALYWALLAGITMYVSSAYKCGCRSYDWIYVIRSAVYKRNKMDPRTDPCGTPNTTIRGVPQGSLSLQQTNWVRWSRYDTNQCRPISKFTLFLALWYSFLQCDTAIPSHVTCVYCVWQNERTYGRYFDTTKRTIVLVFWHRHWLAGDVCFHLKFTPKVTHHLQTMQIWLHYP